MHADKKIFFGCQELSWCTWDIIWILNWLVSLCELGPILQVCESSTGSIGLHQESSAQATPDFKT
jgi:hypothetical protein